MRNLLKIGSLNIPANRWIDALNYFENIYILTVWGEKEYKNPNFKYIKLKNTYLNRKILSLRDNKYFNKYPIIFKLTLYFLRLYNWKTLNNLNSIEFNEVHSSCNDFDDSSYLTIMAYPWLKTKIITRSVKESRPNINLCEKLSFEVADKIVLNTVYNLDFFKKKYPCINWDKKMIILDVDEDFRGTQIMKRIKHDKKLSKTNNKKHFVILTGRANSDDSNIRNGARLFYIPLIKEIISNPNNIVHLHTKNIKLDNKGINKYEELKKNFPNQFYIHKALDFENSPIESYSILSKYNYGILHNFNENTSVSKFDRINIPHRYYEYLLANVIPIIKKKQTVVLEELFRKRKTGIIYTNINDLSCKDFQLDLNYILREYNFQKFIDRVYS